jgi:hypothetical protein
MAISNGYCSLTDVKGALRITDSVDDVLLELAVEGAARQIDGYCERVFYSSVATRLFSASDGYICIVDDISSLDEIKTSSGADRVFDVTWDDTDYQLEPLNGISGGIVSPATAIRAIGDYLFPTSGGEANVKVTATFGWPEIPTAIRQASILLASRQYKRYDSPLGVAGFGDMGVIRVSSIDPDIAKLLEPFMRVRTF